MRKWIIESLIKFESRGNKIALGNSIYITKYINLLELESCRCLSPTSSWGVVSKWQTINPCRQYSNNHLQWHLFSIEYILFVWLNDIPTFNYKHFTLVKLVGIASLSNVKINNVEGMYANIPSTLLIFTFDKLAMPTSSTSVKCL